MMVVVSVTLIVVIMVVKCFEYHGDGCYCDYMDYK